MTTFLLDYDGTLCDTLPAISATVQALFLEYGEPVPPSHEIQALVGTGKTLQETLIKLASLAVERLSFSWIILPEAWFFSVLAIGLTGVLSGLVPALKAEKLQVVEALRSE